ncbi:MAG TPA: hypothetical protein VNT79_07145, partial [Phycisphaerae bacterium]|nr:hypothetical protein [Phycisphaerae bacterium]
FRIEKPSQWNNPTFHYEARFASDDVYWTEFGDEDGIVLHDPISGRPLLGLGYACSPARSVRTNGRKDEWSTHDGETMIHGRPTPERFMIGGRAPERLLDPRSAGLYPRACSETSPTDWLEYLRGLGYDWDEQEIGGKIAVSASSKPKAPVGQSYEVMAWTIDPRRDHAIVEIKGFVEHRDGSRELIEHMTAKHEKVDGRWWPKRCQTKFTRGGGEVFEFSSVEFDRNEHPKVLDADTLNVPPGITAVDRISHNPADGPLRMGRYAGGGRVVSSDEWNNTPQEQSDVLAFANFLQTARAFGHGQYPQWWSAGTETLGLSAVAHTPDLWEAYVRRWILFHSHDPSVGRGERHSKEITASQIEAAWGVLKDCRKRAAPILQRIEKPAIAKANDKGEEKSSDAPKAGGEVAKPKPPNRHEIELEKIFESLKSRLNGLLTTKQDNADGGDSRDKARTVETPSTGR